MSHIRSRAVGPPRTTQPQTRGLWALWASIWQRGPKLPPVSSLGSLCSALEQPGVCDAWLRAIGFILDHHSSHGGPKPGGLDKPDEDPRDRAIADPWRAACQMQSSSRKLQSSLCSTPLAYAGIQAPGRVVSRIPVHAERKQRGRDAA